MAIAQRRVTLEEFLTWPERKPALEYVDGRVIQKVSPKGIHSSLQTELTGIVNAVGRPNRLARAFGELRVTFGGQSSVPDVAVFRWNRIPRTASGEIADDFFVPPDIAVEIRSPRQSVAQQVERCRWYVDNGVCIALFVNPPTRSVTVFRPGVDPVVLRGADPIDLSEILPSFRLTVDELFATLLV